MCEETGVETEKGESARVKDVHVYARMHTRAQTQRESTAHRKRGDSEMEEKACTKYTLHAHKEEEETILMGE